MLLQPSTFWCRLNDPPLTRNVVYRTGYTRECEECKNQSEIFKIFVTEIVTHFTEESIPIVR